jgi:hypothetical protein
MRAAERTRAPCSPLQGIRSTCCFGPCRVQRNHRSRSCQIRHL